MTKQGWAGPAPQHLYDRVGNPSLGCTQSNTDAETVPTVTDTGTPTCVKADHTSPTKHDITAGMSTAEQKAARLLKTLRNEPRITGSADRVEIIVAPIKKLCTPPILVCF